MERLIVALVLGGIGCSLAIAAPRAAIAYILLLTPLMGEIRKLLLYVAEWSGFDPITLVPFTIAGVILVSQRQQIARLPKTPVSRMVFALAAVMALQALNPLQGSPLVGLAGVLFYLVPLAWFWIGRAILNPAQFFRMAMSITFPVALAAAWMGLHQAYVGFLPHQLRWIAEGGYSALNVGGGIMKSFSFFQSSQEYVQFLVLATALVVSPIAARKWPVSSFALPLFFFAALVTGSRGPIVGIDWLDVRLVGIFGRLAPWKGQHVMLDALVLHPQLHAIFVGAPLFGNEVCYQEELESRVKDLGLGQRVKFLGFREDIATLLRAVDFVAHTSIAPEPFGRVIVEGMLAGKPVVASRAGGACEIIEDGVTGRLIPPGDASALADVLCAWSDRSDEARRLGFAGQSSARARFTVEAMVRGVEAETALALGCNG